jgi:geranylgeranyl diphosphate synthase type II
MDKAPLRRGMQTVHAKYGDATALLAGDVMFAQAYDYLTRIDLSYVQKIIKLFNQTSKEVCEGQQIDMDFEQMQNVGMEQYIQMITLKTSVLLAASLQLGAILGGAGEGNQQHIYSFGKNLGIAFQIQDDYLDAFGDPEKFGKQIGGDILSNKKTFLLLHVIEVATANQKNEIDTLISTNPTDKVEKMLTIYKDCKVDEWAKELKEKYYKTALKNLADIAVLAIRKKPLYELATYLMERES